ncbi:DUF3800 domain-containing protein [Marinobacter sp. NFXS9]|uniref:DUF3800 domain-containing protein n=1 Tax=Marinobacter sp. NFXS9 TaxID=2818433 RepID=UPI0032DED11A
MEKTFVFIDESGNHDLEIEKDGVTGYFMVLAVLVNEDHLANLNREVELIRAKHFQTGEMKSSSVKDKDKHARRNKILSAINALDFKFYLLALDKKSVEKDGGLQYKKSFIKFVNRLLYSSLISSFDDLEIYADSHGNVEFQKSFYDYITSLGTDDLFRRKTLKLVDSQDVPLVQLADFLVGSFAKIYEKRAVNDSLREATKNLLLSKCIGLAEWPVKNRLYQNVNTATSDYDPQIYKHALSKADDFISKKSGATDYETAMQLVALNFLLFKDRFVSEDSYIPTNEIISHLHSHGFQSVAEQSLRSSIIAKLRDNGVIIASSNKGYKIPRSAADLVAYALRVNGQIIPLLSRLHKARNSYLLATKGEFDLLGSESFEHLRHFIDVLPENALADHSE